MGTRHDLITLQDLHAYIDGELSGDRLRAVEAYLASNDLAFGEALTIAQSVMDLRVVRDQLYKDDELKNEIDALLKRSKKLRSKSTKRA